MACMCMGDSFQSSITSGSCVRQVLQSRAKAAAQAASPAVALAAAMSVESPFIHIDNVSVSAPSIFVADICESRVCMQHP